MKVGIIQSNYIPWRGYFDFIDDVDLFIYHDDLQYTKGDWRNRNKIKTPTGLIWLTVPVCYNKTSQQICHTKIDYSQPWQHKHINKIKANYCRAPYYDDFATEFFALLNKRYNTISELNVQINNWLMRKLFIKTEIKMSWELKALGSKTDRLLDILKETNATGYVSGPAAADYLEIDKFKAAGISLEYKSYKYMPYPQLHGQFAPRVSVLDLLFNCGSKARQYLKSTSVNKKIV